MKKIFFISILITPLVLYTAEFPKNFQNTTFSPTDTPFLNIAPDEDFLDDFFFSLLTPPHLLPSSDCLPITLPPLAPSNSYVAESDDYQKELSLAPSLNPLVSYLDSLATFEPIAPLVEENTKNFDNLYSITLDYLSELAAAPSAPLDLQKAATASLFDAPLVQPASHSTQKTGASFQELGKELNTIKENPQLAPLLKDYLHGIMTKMRSTFSRDMATQTDDSPGDKSSRETVLNPTFLNTPAISLPTVLALSATPVLLTAPSAPLFPQHLSHSLPETQKDFSFNQLHEETKEALKKRFASLLESPDTPGILICPFPSCTHASNAHFLREIIC